MLIVLIELMSLPALFAWSFRHPLKKVSGEFINKNVRRLNKQETASSDFCEASFEIWLPS